MGGGGGGGGRDGGGGGGGWGVVAESILGYDRQRNCWLPGVPPAVVGVEEAVALRTELVAAAQGSD